MTEAEIQRAVMLAVGASPGVRLFRNNTGLGWQGDVVQQTRELITLANYRAVTYGLCVGSSDLIGWAHGRFAAVEVKNARGKPTREQNVFLDNVRAAGGVAGVVRSPFDAMALLSIKT